MNAPLYLNNAFNTELSLVVAFAIGITFGFFLERGGLGSAEKLTKQFYLKDLTVFKVMFTAIVTAMLGVFFLGAVGFLDISQIYISPTHLIPQAAGGLLLGAGFIIGGYCPGTSIVSTSTGRIDGFVFLIGVMAGIFVFGEAYPIVEGFYNSDYWGEIRWFEHYNMSYGLAVLLVAIMAVGGFLGAEWVERKIGYKKSGANK